MDPKIIALRDKYKRGVERVEQGLTELKALESEILALGKPASPPESTPSPKPEPETPKTPAQETPEPETPAATGRTCPSCGVVNEVGRSFCIACKTELTDNPSPHKASVGTKDTATESPEPEPQPEPEPDEQGPTAAPETPEKPPVPIDCKGCGTMLAGGTTKCPVCGKDL